MGIATEVSMKFTILVLLVCVSLLDLGQAQSGGFMAANRQKKRRQILEEVLAEIEDEESSREKRQTSSCRRGFHQPNYSYQGKNYLLSWRHGCTEFSQSEADSFCRNSNMRPISIDDSQEEREIRDLILREKQKYIWTGGKPLALAGRSPGHQDGGTTTWPGLKLGVLTVLSRIIGWVTSSVLLFSTISTTTESLSMMSGVGTRSQSFVKLEYLIFLSIMVCFYLKTLRCDKYINLVD